MINIIILIMIMISTNSDAPIGETQAAHLLIATFGGETFNFFGFPGIQPRDDHPDGPAPETDLLCRQYITGSKHHRNGQHPPVTFL